MKNTFHKLLKVALCFGMVGLAMQTQGQMVVVNVGINQPAALVADAGNAQVSLCEGDGITLGGNPTASGGLAPFTYAWSPSGSLNAATVANPIATPNMTTAYNLQITDANNCSSSANTTVNVLAAAVAAFATGPGSGLTVAFLDQSTGSVASWSWDFGDGGTSTLQNPSHTYATAGQYTVCLTVTNPGCTSTTCDTLSAIVGLDNAFAIPGLSVYPNPYQGTTHIRFGMTEAAPVRLVAYDLSGKLIGTVFEGDLDAGEQTLHFSAADYGASAGVYMLRLQVGDAQATLRVNELR